MPNAMERALADELARGACYFGEIVIRTLPKGFLLSHRDDEKRKDLSASSDVEDAIEIAKLDDAGNYRPLKTAPNLRHGWQLKVTTGEELCCALDYFYPGRLAVLAAWKHHRLEATDLRQTLDRQSGMYRIASKISDEQIDDLVGNFCRSDSGCLRTIFWKRDATGTLASTKLPTEKFDPDCDQVALRPRSAGGAASRAIPLLCQEACNLLVAGCREAVKMEGAAPSALD